MARGRRANSNGERSKQLLLEKAMELFSMHGYHETKISDIVNAANLTQPTFYLYFQSKDKLFNDLNEEFEKNLVARLTDTLENSKIGNTDARNYIFESLKNMFIYFVENPNLTKIGFYGSAEATKLKDKIITKLIQLLKNEGEAMIIHNEVELDLLAHSLLGSVERLTLRYLLTKERSPEKLANDILTIYFSESRKLAYQ